MGASDSAGRPRQPRWARARTLRRGAVVLLATLGLRLLAPQAVTHEMGKHGTVHLPNLAFGAAEDSYITHNAQLAGGRAGPTSGVGQHGQLATLDLVPYETREFIGWPVCSAPIDRKLRLAIGRSADFPCAVENAAAAGYEET